ncbi:MAG TPA: bifunctional transaldolase/phosoglucose isomerase [Actinomycetota bacterium]|nr:bifunctional transaldolase/phosoglucose isomerase [Actinomycetota bacterium]
MNRLQQLHQAGTAIWLDFLRRGLIEAGELTRMIDEWDLTGVTSNPSIFKKAIGGSTDYDEAIAEISQEERDPTDVFYELALQDIQDAASVFAGVYEKTNHQDGYVSFELESSLAHDTEVSISKAKELFARIDRPNVMIKVPGTAAGVHAVEELTAAGVNVNITLLFSVESYIKVAEAYINGLELRRDAGLPIDSVASVASFFISRVDTAVDARLPDRSPLRGKVAIANAKVAYQRFQELFSGPRWEKLAAAGARVQRPLWASTGTKNPDYPDTLYVDELIGPDTVNTMPQQTMDAFLDHGNVKADSLTDGVEQAHATLAALADLGIDLKEIGADLEKEGIEAFEKDFTSLLSTLEQKIERVCAGRVRWQTLLDGKLSPLVHTMVRELSDNDAIGRIWRKDHTLWKDDPTEITDRLGWLTVADTMLERVPDLEEFAKQAWGEGMTHAVVLGMGGSSLVSEVFRNSFPVQDHGMELVILDSTHPRTVARVRDSLPLDKTMFIVASKSGTTVESISHFGYFFNLVGNPQQFVAITDPGTRLARLANLMGFRKVFINPPDIGGRYSALSLFGLVPAALAGVDLYAILDDAEEMACASHHCVPVEQNPGAWLGITQGVAATQGVDKVTVVLPEEIRSLGDWIEQLIAESTGKQGRGILPVVGEDLASPEHYGRDRLFISLGDAPGLDALAAAGHPVVKIDYTRPTDLGGEFFRWEFAVAVAGYILGINPFDQPNVAQAKEATKAILDSGAFEDPGLDDLKPLVESIKPGDYVAILAYLDRTEETERELQAVRLKFRDDHRVATTVGFGPRYLHSTGQLHKGGPNTGVFIQVIDADMGEDLPIPDAPYSFGDLIRAQALGDYRSLKDAGRRVARVTLEQLREVMS